jgi:hypothetical protein
MLFNEMMNILRQLQGYFFSYSITQSSLSLSLQLSLIYFDYRNDRNAARISSVNN